MLRCGSWPSFFCGKEVASSRKLQTAGGKLRTENRALIAGDYLFRLEARSLDAIWALGCNSPEDELRFALNLLGVGAPLTTSTGIGGLTGGPAGRVK